MDYFKEAFGGFSPPHDADGAVKFALNALLMDHRTDELVPLLTDGHDIGGVEGDPGWIMERRDVGESGNMPGYLNWPAGKYFRAHVDDDAFKLGFPEFFMDRDTFHKYVSMALRAYVQLNPEKLKRVSGVLSMLG